MKHLSHTSPLTSHPLGAVHCCSISPSWQFNSLGIDMNSQGSQGVYSIQGPTSFKFNSCEPHPSSPTQQGSHEFGAQLIGS